MPITFLHKYILHMVVSVMLENKLDSLGNKYPSNWAMSGNSLGSIPVAMTDCRLGILGYG